jgi:hypothetical protein
MVPPAAGPNPLQWDPDAKEGARMAQEGTTQAADPGWGRAVITAVVMLVSSFVLLALIPNMLLGYLSTRVEPWARDLLVAGCWALAFVVCCVIFVRLQPGRRG